MIGDEAATSPESGYGLLLDSGLYALHMVADILIGLSFLALPVAIFLFLAKRRDTPRDSWLGLFFLAAVLLLVGVTFLAEAYATWRPAFALHGAAKALAAVAALAAAVTVWRSLPTGLARPSLETVEASNADLIALGEKQANELRLSEASRQSLEAIVAERTRELNEIRQRFEAATSGAQITVFAQDRDLNYTWVHNPRLGIASEDAIGHQAGSVRPMPGAEEAIANARRVLESGKSQTYEFESQEGATTVWFRVSVTPLVEAGGQVSGLVTTAIDITRPKRLEGMRADLSRRLAETVQRFNLALRSSDILVFSLDSNLSDLWANTDDPKLRLILGADDRVSEERSKLATLMREAMASGEAQYTEISVGEGESRAWYDLHIEPRVSTEGEVIGVVCAAVDVTERKRNEQRMRLVMRELSHRSKNMLAVVQAIARQTAQQASGVAEFVDGFGQRLRALASAQDLLVAENWAGAHIDDLVRSQVGHYSPEESRVMIEGPRVSLSPEATQTLALALHELATNAAKHGALSNDRGIVRVDWSVSGPAPGDSVEINWRESGGPPVAAPVQRGFGRIVIEFNVARSLNAEVNLDFQPGGIHAQFRIPGRHIVEEGAVAKPPSF